MNRKGLLLTLINFFVLAFIISHSTDSGSNRIVRGDPFLYNISLNQNNRILNSDKPPTPSVQSKSISILGWGGSTANTYDLTGEQTGDIEGVGVSLTLNNFNATSGQIRGNSSAPLNFNFHNNIPIPGALTKVTLRVAEGEGTLVTTSPSTRNLLFVGQSTQANITTSSSAISVSETTSNVTSISWSIDPSDNITYFRMYNLHTSGTVLANLNNSITIEYEDFSTSKTYKTVDMMYERVFMSSNNHTLIGASISNNPGRIYNHAATQVTSITSIIATFSFSTLSGGELRLTTGSNGQPLGNSVTLQSGVEVTISNNPYFFMISNVGSNTVYLESLDIYYSCLEAEPEEYSGDLIEFTGSSDPDEGMEFLYWKNVQTEKLVSYEPEFTGLVPVWANIQPVYRPISDSIYSTGFETLKSSYTRGTTTFDSKVWLFDQALTGSAIGDLYNGSRAARLHGGGFIQTQFDHGYLSEITFLHGVYGSDTLGAKLALQFSQSGWDWITLDDNIVPSYIFNTYTYKFNLVNMYLQGTFDPAKPTYIRIFNQNRASSSNGVRINIDDLVIKSYSSFAELPLKSNQSNRLNFQFENQVQTIYEKNEPFILDENCLAVDPVTNQSLDCDVVHNVITAQTGQYEVTYFNNDVYGDLIEKTYKIYVLEDTSLLNYDFTSDYGGYYEGINGLFGNDLVIELRKKSYQTMQAKSYEYAKEFLRLSDVDPNNPDNAIAIYTSNSVFSEWDGGLTWQREHVWPNSRLGARRVAEGDRHIASDLYNLRFIEAGVNASRSNRSFNEDNTNSLTYNPGDDKGDVARIYFYMDITYDWISMTDLILGTGEDTYTMSGAISGQKSYLFQAHIDDPISSFELYRYNLLIQNQGNRNPFIDYPDLVHLIYF
jgi:endonuclease I